MLMFSGEGVAAGEGLGGVNSILLLQLGLAWLCGAWQDLSLQCSCKVLKPVHLSDHLAVWCCLVRFCQYLKAPVVSGSGCAVRP